MYDGLTNFVFVDSEKNRIIIPNRTRSKFILEQAEVPHHEEF